jgi:cytochrome c-type biogenesis protein CcsB
VVVLMGLAGFKLYATAGPLVPALHSYWLVIHVSAMATASGTFAFGFVAAALFLIRERYEARVAAAEAAGSEPVLRFPLTLAPRLPKAASLERLAFRVHAFAFPIWTFGVMCGAIWAEHAWGRYWGWDPKETWSFITWLVYASFLHARATAGWRGRRAAFIQLFGFACLMFNLVGVNLWITGLHSYAGIS